MTAGGGANGLPRDVVALVHRARAGAVDDVDLFLAARALDAAESGDVDARVRALRGLLAPGRRGEGFYLDDAFAPALRAARDAFAASESEDALATLARVEASARGALAAEIARVVDREP